MSRKGKGGGIKGKVEGVKEGGIMIVNEVREGEDGFAISKLSNKYGIIIIIRIIIISIINMINIIKRHNKSNIGRCEKKKKKSKLSK